MTGIRGPESSPDGNAPRYECRYCDGYTHDSSRVCPDCAFENAHTEGER